MPAKVVSQRIWSPNGGRENTRNIIWILRKDWKLKILLYRHSFMAVYVTYTLPFKPPDLSNQLTHAIIWLKQSHNSNCNILLLPWYFHHKELWVSGLTSLIGYEMWSKLVNQRMGKGFHHVIFTFDTLLLGQNLKIKCNCPSCLVAIWLPTVWLCFK